jgi:integrase
VSYFRPQQAGKIGPRTLYSFSDSTSRLSQNAGRSGVHAFRYGCNRRWELSGMNPAVLCQQMGHSSAVMTPRYTGRIPLGNVQDAFSKMELKNMEVIGKRPLCTGGRLVVYNQQTRGMSGRRTMAV